MKNILTLLVLMIALVVRASDCPPATIYGTYATTLLSTTAASNGSSIFIECLKYHTFQFVFIATNAVSNVAQVSLNNANWSPLTTNSASASATNIYYVDGKFSFIRVVAAGVGNFTNTVSYLGGR